MADRTGSGIHLPAAPLGASGVSPALQFYFNREDAILALKHKEIANQNRSEIVAAFQKELDIARKDRRAQEQEEEEFAIEERENRRARAQLQAERDDRRLHQERDVHLHPELVYVRDIFDIRLADLRLQIARLERNATAPPRGEESEERGSFVNRHAIQEWGMMLSCIATVHSIFLLQLS
jgi:hypothetical protein